MATTGPIVRSLTTLQIIEKTENNPFNAIGNSGDHHRHKGKTHDGVDPVQKKIWREQTGGYSRLH